MGEGGEYGGRTDDRQREIYESKEQDKEVQEREVGEYREKTDEIANELEREMEDEERAQYIANELEKELEDKRTSKEMDGDFERELGHDIGEVRDDLHDDFVNDMKRQLDEASTKETANDKSTENGTSTSSEMTEYSESCEGAGGGMANAMETKGDSEGETRTETESETEGELEKQSQESTEQNSNGESSERSEQKFTNKIEHSEDTDHEAESEPTSEGSANKEESGGTRQSKIEDYVGEGSKDKAESQESSTSRAPQEIDEDVSEPDATEFDSKSTESEITNHQSDHESETKEFEENVERSKVIEKKDEPSKQDTEPSSEMEHECSAPEDEILPKSETENLDDFVERVKNLLDEKPELDENYDYVQDPLTGEIQRVPRILSDCETEEQKHRRKLRNLLSELSEEERRCFKKIIRENAEGENEHSAEAVEKAWDQIVEKAIRYRENETNTRFKVTMKESDSIQEIKGLADELLTKMSETEKRVSFLELDLDEMEQKNVQRLSRFLDQSKDELDREIRKCLKAEETEIRIGVVDNRVYLWITNESRNNMLNAWSKQYYYFKENGMLKRLQESAFSNLGLDPKSAESKFHFNKLMDQILQYSDNETLRKSRHLKENRIHGETLKFLIDSMGNDTELLGTGVAKITGIKGQGGLENPAFPKGEELEILRARVIGTVVSDGQVRGSKGLMYYESSEDRINRFENTLRNFGDIHLKRKFRKSRGVYEIYINSAMSEAAIFWRIPEGDRTILNYGLPSDVYNWSKNAQRALIQDMFSQEGCVSENGDISWNRRHALCAGNKSEKYDFQSKLSQETVEFLKTSKEANREYEKGNAGEIYLTIGQLEDLQNDQDKFKTNAAKELLQVVTDYRNQLIDDEVEIVRGFGIRVTVDPMQVSYYKRSGRVSVRWQARIRDDESKMKCAILLSPNDSIKERILDEWLSKQNPEDIDPVRNNLKNEGYEIRSAVPRDEPLHRGRDPS